MSSALKPLLAAHEGWSADAYRTETGYGVWRVQFYFPGGEELGWADVSPAQGEVYAWEASYELGGALQRRAERTLYPFVLRHPDVRALLGREEPLERWLWYDSWREGWFVHLERGAGSLEVSVRSRRPGSLQLQDLFIEKIYFPNVLSLADHRPPKGAAPSPSLSPPRRSLRPCGIRRAGRVRVRRLKAAGGRSCSPETGPKSRAPSSIWRRRGRSRSPSKTAPDP